MNVIKTLLILLGLLIGGALLFGLRRTYVSEHSSRHEQFRRGTADISNLNGEYRGKVPGYSVRWQGKTFNQAKSSGINRFQENNTIVNKYPFKTYVGRGLRDQDMEVIKIDYNQPDNPWWLRFIVDEIVTVAPNTYLGKVHLRLMPRVVFTMGYFTLEKSQQQ